MADNKKSVNLLPEYLKTDKNSKFLSGTLDPLIQTPQLERIDGFVGSKISPNYDPTTDFYINEDSNLRTNYSLEPALVFKDKESNITDVVSFDDIINELEIQGAKTNNLDRLFRSKIYSYDPYIDWDKLVNYNQYYWLVNGPDSILIDSAVNVDTDIIGMESYTMPNGYDLSNGMKIKFSLQTITTASQNKEFYVEGVGTSIKLVAVDLLQVNDSVSYIYNETFDSDAFDSYPFDGDSKLPTLPEYVTINRSSNDLNPWSRYNRWFHGEIIRITSEINNQTTVYPVTLKAKRPIVEFKPNLQLYNFGIEGIENIDLIDTNTVNVFSDVNGTVGYYVDQVLLEQGQRVVFNAAGDPSVREKIYQVNYINNILTLEEVGTALDQNSMSVNYGLLNQGTSWHYNASTSKWVGSQQRTHINQAPLFDIFDSNNDSFGNKEPGSSNFIGSKIFGYDVGTGTADSVLGFPLKYQNSVGVGSYLFKNYFMSDVVNITTNGVSSNSTTGIGYFKINIPYGTTQYPNVWQSSVDNPIPVVEIQTVINSTSTLKISSFNQLDSLSVSALINNSYAAVTINTATLTVTFDKTLKINDVVSLEIVTNSIPNSNGFYKTPLSLTNNPLNGPITDMTLSELENHLLTMVNRIDNFSGVFPGTSNLRDLSDYTKFGTRLIINSNPIAFAQMFLGKKEHNVVDALRLAADQYNQFKMNLLRVIAKIDSNVSPAAALDIALLEINASKNSYSSYYRSDMLGYGGNKVVRSSTVTNVNIVTYPIGNDFDLTSLSFKSVLVYVNDEQLAVGEDYTVLHNEITFTNLLSLGDVIDICYYPDTLGSFVPATPSKLGLYPAYAPAIYFDSSYIGNDVNVIQGHDGSILPAYNDYRDAIILEFEKRVYNNIKVSYDATVFDVNAVIPGAFRKDKYVLSDATDILTKDFIKWTGTYNIDAYTNNSFDEGNPFSWNYKGSVGQLGNTVPGHWRGIYKYFYDTDRPHTHPWEMLGYSSKPSWWDTYYSWTDNAKRSALISAIINGKTNEPPSIKVNRNYARSLFLYIVPVDNSGNLKDPASFLVSANGYTEKTSKWVFGDQGPAETAWRKSSYWPFALNAAAALLDPCTYTSTMYDTSRTQLNQLGQINYLTDDLYLNLNKLLIEGPVQTAGFGVYIVEKGLQKDLNYRDTLNQDFDYLDFNLFHKVGGFVSKDKLQILIDSIDPLSQAQGVVLPPEDYTLLLNVSNPIKSASISGVIVQKFEGKFIVKGYDKINPYFEILNPISLNSAGALSVGGKSEQFTEWASVVNNGNSGLSSIDITSTQSNTTRYYKPGQLVRYNGTFYRVKVGHTAQSTFNLALFYPLPSLPVTGGATVQLPSRFETTVTKVPYGTSYTSVQQVYDMLLGYGAYLKSQGFIFDEFNTDLNEIIDWKFTGKEFLYWSTQNWADGNLITLSPFADYLKYSFADSIVDNISTGKYEYSLLKADGKSFPIDKFRLAREDGVCTITAVDTQEGIFFATLNSVQKEHGMVFNNSTIFNDTIYDIETGYKQRRIKLSGFRTLNWNGDLSSPGFVYDSVDIVDWKTYSTYLPGKVVRYNGAYYESNIKIVNDATFDFVKWTKLNSKPESNLLPNFDYKINQFEDFYSLDIDNFDSAQQQLAQHLIGYTPRTYLNNIFTNPVSQYKFYQGFIREKGTKNAIDKLAKVGKFTRQGEVSITEDWAFRTGEYGGFSTYNELEFTLHEGISSENPYATKIVNSIPTDANPLLNYVQSASLLLTPNNFDPTASFITYPSTYDDNNIELPMAGYVRANDVTVTAYNKNSLLDIANNSLIKEGDTIWLGFLENGSWTVYRYAKQSAKIAGVFLSAPGESITFTSDINHGLSVGDIVSVVRFNDQVNGIYIVSSIPRLDQFTVASTLVTIVDATLLSYGALFKFENVRYNNTEQLAGTKDVLTANYGEKVWIDSGEDGKWKVYEKVKNYSTASNIYNTLSFPLGQKLGTAIYATDNSNVVLASAPGFDPSVFPVVKVPGIGRVWVYFKNAITGTLSKQFEYALNSISKTYCNISISSDFGYSLSYDTNKKLYVAGAPAATNVRGPNSPTGVVTLSTGAGNVRSFTSEGLVKISSKKTVINQEQTEAVLLNPYPASNDKFGHSIYVASTSATASSMLLVSAPGNNTGRVHAYSITRATLTAPISVAAHSQGITLASHVALTNGSQFGHKIAGSDSGNIIAISAPNYTATNITGVVQLFNKNLNWIQTIYSPFGTTEAFGNEVSVSADGTYIFVSSINTKTVGEPYGKVAVYKFNGTVATLHQIINNPFRHNNLKFGTAISISKDNETLVISALGINESNILYFDVDTRTGETTFDGGTTQFSAPVPESGTVYVFNNLEGYFIPSDELTNSYILTSSRYGASVAATNNRIFIGAPSTASSGSDNSTLFQYDKIDNGSSSWNLLRQQEDLVDVSTINRIALIDSLKEEVTEYLEIIDPVKGKISGLAEQELKYRSAFDPATYSIGLANNIVDADTSWIDEHVGELWWDLSTVKYTWYEQGDEIYRKNNWGKLFPGSSVDVYEWVKSDLLPSEWAAQADTNSGLTSGISGQPKYPNNSSISVKQLFNNVTNSFENVYYFWVKNKVTVPGAKNRRISSYQVSRIISDPLTYGLKFAEIVSPSSIAFANIQTSLIGNRISVNIASDSGMNNIPRHTEWILLSEGTANSVPTPLLEKKLIDSLLGHDLNGNAVPDIFLTSRNRYGTGIRPQQTLFKDRIGALRNVIEFANSVLIKNIITAGTYNFDTLNLQEPLPDLYTREYDLIVDSREVRNAVDSSLFEQATIECVISNGKIASATIVNPGYGYSLAPSVTIVADLSGAELLTEINANGQVVAVTISNSGSGFVNVPQLIVRPHTVVITTDAEWQGLWTKHQFDYNARDTNTDQDSWWIRIKNQTYNTPLYWNNVDWVDDTFNQFKDYQYVINTTEEIASLYDVAVGDYVYIKNLGDGNYAILERVSTEGNFSPFYNIVYRKAGTIQINESIWNYNNLNYDYDIATLDETLYDQIPDLEVYYILQALKNDIFVNDLKINWNLFFFAAVRYALTEQKLLDWAFKTSFINVTNQVGVLDQRPVYKLDNEQYFEEYVREVKPYHSNIRTYTSKYTYLDDLYDLTLTDFDFPSQAWTDNHTYSVGSVIVAESGTGYTTTPVVTINGGGPNVTTTATAEAYLRSGGVYKILITDPGAGYTELPSVSITGTNLTNATASAILLNQTVRKNTVGLKFNRVSSASEIGDLQVNDTFTCSGRDDKFVLSWLAEPNKLNIQPTLDGRLILSSDYTIEYYTETYNDYSKKYSRFVFLNYVPAKYQVFNITYNKSIQLYTAVDMIEQLYTGTFAISSLMTGTVFPGSVVQGLPFNYSIPWDTNNSYDVDSWSDIVTDYTSAKLVANATTGTTILYLNTTTGIVPWQEINFTNYSTNVIRSNTVVSSVNSVLNYITIDNSYYNIRYGKSTSTNVGTEIIFKTITAFNGGIVEGDRITVDGIDDYGFNGTYQVSSIIDIDRFAVISTVELSTTTTYPSAASSATLFSVLENIETNGIYIDRIVDRFSYNTESFVVDTQYAYDDVSKIVIFKDGLLAPMLTGIPIIGPYPAQEYYRAVKSSNGRLVLEFYQMTDAYYDLDINLYSDPTIEFWNTAGIIAGLSTTTTVISSTFNVDPVNYTLDGDSFLNVRSGYAPEEAVNGTVLDSLGINVYTKGEDSTALVYSGSFLVTPNDTSEALTIPWAYAGIMVHFNGEKFTQVANQTEFTLSTQFYMVGNTIHMAPQTVTGRAGFTAISIGGDYSVIDGNMVTVNNSSLVIVESLASIRDIKKVYVLIDGQEVGEIFTPIELADGTGRASVVVTGLNPTRTHTVEVWFFQSDYTNFNRVHEEIFTVSGSTVELLVAPKKSEPVSAQVIVEQNGLRLTPPAVSYYKVENNQRIYKVDNKHVRDPNTYTANDVSVYVNGVTLRPGFEYVLNESNNTITIVQGLLRNGDVIAVMGLVSGEYEYLIDGNIVSLNTPIIGATLRVISFTDHDNMLIRTEQFDGSPYRKFAMSLPLPADDYVWVYVDGVPLTARYDFEILDDSRTIQISDAIKVTSSSTVIVTTINPASFGTDILGYRIFEDMFGKQGINRLADFYTTSLSSPLHADDSEIYVVDGSKLISPNPATNSPGVVIIDGERIEFFKKDNNRLSRLRRSTLGTGPADVSAIGTKVIDQSFYQDLLGTEVILVQSTSTTATTYAISEVGNSVIGDGITFVQGVDLVDQVSVYYGGRQLRKSPLYYHDTAISYDPTVDSVSILPPEFTITINTPRTPLLVNDSVTGRPPTGSGWVFHETTATMQIQPGWIMQDASGARYTVTYSGHNTLFNGWGVGFANSITIAWPLTFIEPKIQQLTLNISDTNGIDTDIKIVQKKGQVWTGTGIVSLLASTSIQATFLQDKKAILPDRYYYGE